VESGQTSEILQRVESDASPLSPDSPASFKVPSVVTQYEHHAQEEKDTNEIEYQEPEGQVHDLMHYTDPR